MEKQDYSEFRTINIFDIGLFTEKLSEATFFKRNNIVTIEDLFQKWDEWTFDFGEINNLNQARRKAYIKGIIKLIRYRYLNKDITSGVESLTMPYERNMIFKTEFIEAGNNIGLTKTEANIIFNSHDTMGEYGIKIG